MSTEPGTHRTLGGYVYELLLRLGSDDPAAVSRIREIVGLRRARIRLDDELAEAWFDEDGFHVVEQATAMAVEGEGWTDRQTVLDILDGRLEGTAAIVDGYIHITGEPENVIRILQSIEILLDGSVRSPALQALAEDYRRERPRGVGRGAAGPDAAASGSELSVLRRLGLLPDVLEPRPRTRRRSV